MVSIYTLGFHNTAGTNWADLPCDHASSMLFIYPIFYVEILVGERDKILKKSQEYHSLRVISPISNLIPVQSAEFFFIICESEWKHATW